MTKKEREEGDLKTLPARKPHMAKSDLILAAVLLGGGYLLFSKKKDSSTTALDNLSDAAAKEADDLSNLLNNLFKGAKTNADLFVQSAQTAANLATFQPVQRAGYDVFGNLTYLYGYGGGSWGAGWVADPDKPNAALINSQKAAYNALIEKGYTSAEILGNSASVASILGTRLTTAYSIGKIPQPYTSSGAADSDVFAPIKQLIDAVQTGLNTPGGTLGAQSATDIGYQIQKEIDAINLGINTPGGTLGAQSATDLQYQLNKLWGNIASVFGW